MLAAVSPWSAETVQQSSGAVVTTVDQPSISSGAEVHLRDLGRISAPEVGGSVAVDNSPAAAFAQANGLSGLSPASLAPTGVTGLPETPSVLLDGEAFSAAVADAVAATPSRSYADEFRFLEPITNPETAAHSVGFATQAEFLAANAAVPEAGSGVASTAPGTYDPYPEGQPASLDRSNFGSDMAWIEANGWHVGTTTDGDQAFFLSINDVEQ